MQYGARRRIIEKRFVEVGTTRLIRSRQAYAMLILREVGMAADETIIQAILTGHAAIPFRDLERVLRRLGFVVVRVRGSHYIYRHPRIPRHINIQPVGNEAKSYQVRQLRDMIVECNIKLGA
jgi:predicted RNA binding protein YcfA (HicA-like mRNA interferase family)